MNTFAYQIEAITNLQVGNGEINYGVIDNLIQRDAATGFPVINASSLKGALREHCAHYIKNGEQKNKIISSLFGSDPNGKERCAGNLRFFDANLLSMPVRSDKAPFLMGSCPLLINDYISKCQLFSIPLKEDKISQLSEVLSKVQNDMPVVMQKEHADAIVEDFEHEAKYIGDNINTELFRELTDSPSILFSDDDFKTLCNEDHLPVIARNNLTQGHENLWYEQVLPRFSRLYFYILSSDDSVDDTLFHECITKHLVQIGANATVGYGYCKLTRIS